MLYKIPNVPNELVPNGTSDEDNEEVFKEGEIPRPMSEVPHPFVVETVSIFTNETAEIKNKIHFIHFNHSNPALQERHHLKDSIIHLGFNFAKEGDIYAL